MLKTETEEQMSIRNTVQGVWPLFLPVTKWSVVRKTWVMGRAVPAWLNSRKLKERRPKVKVRPVTINGEYWISRQENGLGIPTNDSTLTSKHINTRVPDYKNINGGHTRTTSIIHVQRWTTHWMMFTSTDGTIITPADIAVRHSETTDTLWALQFISFVTGEMHCGSTSAVKLQTGTNTSASKSSLKFPI